MLDKSTQGDLRAATVDLEALGEFDWSQDFTVAHDGWGSVVEDHWSVWNDPPSNHTLALEARHQLTASERTAADALGSMKGALGSLQKMRAADQNRGRQTRPGLFVPGRKCWDCL